MAIHYPESNLKIMDYNRVLKSLNGLSTEEFLDKVTENYHIRIKDEGEELKPSEKFESSLYIDKKWYSIRIKDERIDKTNPVKMLDSELLT